jgi:catechol 2,3-dioxygenase-like lactoylglutathione lyase family enzyme
MDVPIVHHVQIAMPEQGEDLARQFYGEILGFPEVPKPDVLRQKGGVWFRTGNLDLHLGVDRPFVAAKKAHVAYEVSDLEWVMELLVKAGFPIDEDEYLPGYDRFYTADPFGNRVELLRARDDRS